MIALWIVGEIIYPYCDFECIRFSEHLLLESDTMELRIILKEVKEMTNKVSRFIYWTPRLLSIVFIFFLALMSLDVITPEASILQIVVGLLIHNIPAIIMLIVLIIAWRHEIVGGIAFILAGLLYMVMVIRWGKPWYLVLTWSFTIAGPAFIIGILFLINWFKKRQSHS